MGTEGDGSVDRSTADMTDTIQALKKRLGTKAKEHEMLAPYTTFKIGGPADLFIDVKTKEELVEAVEFARICNVPIFILGGGTNILIGDKGIRGLVIKNSTSKILIRGMKGSAGQGSSTRVVFVEADSGVPLNKLVRTTVDEGLAGLEMHLGLPGTVGGAVYMNSKWMHPEGYVGDAVYQAEILTQAGLRKIVPQTYFQFAYDTSYLQKTHDIVLSVVFSLQAAEKNHLWNISNESISYRRLSQPQGVKSAGCTFRNISLSQVLSLGLPGQATSAGFLVDHAGLKGLKVNDAQISPMHANFIINTGQASASDVVQLITRAQDQVKRQFGVILEEEIVRVGEF